MQISLAKKLYGLTAGILGILLVVFLISFVSLTTIISGYQNLTETGAGQVQAGLAAQNELGLAMQDYRGYLIHGDDAFLKGFSGHVNALVGDIERYGKLSEDPDEVEAFKTARDIASSFTHVIDNVAKIRQTSKDIRAIDAFVGKDADKQLREALSHADETAITNYERDKAKMAKLVSILRWVQVALLLAGLGFGIAASTWIIRGTLTAVREVKTAAEVASRGDLSRDVPVSSRDEIGEMAKHFNIMMANLRQIADRITSSTGSLASSSEELSATSEDISKGARELSTQTEQVVTAMTEVSRTIMDMARNATQAADASKTASDTAVKGKQIVDSTADDMMKIAQTVQGAAVTIEGLGKSSAQIGEIVAVINGIADQTNLLALNAAIEAARAGEQGRGFAVVADEVRKLAERTAQSTKDITQRIESIQRAAAESVDVMKKGSDEVDKGVVLAREASTSLDSIVAASTSSLDMVQRIAAATEEQSAASEQVTQNMENISGITRRSSAATEQIRVSAAELARLASELKTMTAWFRLNEAETTGASAYAAPAR